MRREGAHATTIMEFFPRWRPRGTRPAEDEDASHGARTRFVASVSPPAILGTHVHGRVYRAARVVLSSQELAVRRGSAEPRCGAYAALEFSRWSRS